MRKSTKKNFIKIIAAQFVLVALLSLAVLPAHTSAVSNTLYNPVIVAEDLQTQINPGQLPKPNAGKRNVENVVQIALGIIGAFALMNITFSGMKYITSAGNPQRTSEAKNGIIYALVGLILAISAEAIVAFVVRGPK